jgi:YD repeat-containing protein
MVSTHQSRAGRSILTGRLFHSGQLATETLNGTLLATPNYDTFGRLASTTNTNTNVTTPAVAYGNGTSLSTVTYASTGAVTGDGWSFASGQPTVSDATVLSQSGRVLQDTITDTGAAAPFTSTYTYDAAGRLTGASVPDNTLG